MSISDNLMVKYYELISDIPTEEFNHLKRAIENQTENPLVYKKRLAKEIVSRYHGIKSGEAAEERFAEIHQKKKIPDDLEKSEIDYRSDADLTAYKLLTVVGRAKSNSEGRRLIQYGGVKINGIPISDPNYKVDPKDGSILQVGPRYFKELHFKKVGP